MQASSGWGSLVIISLRKLGAPDCHLASVSKLGQVRNNYITGRIYCSLLSLCPHSIGYSLYLTYLGILEGSSYLLSLEVNHLDRHLQLPNPTMSPSPKLKQSFLSLLCWALLPALLLTWHSQPYCWISFWQSSSACVLQVGAKQVLLCLSPSSRYSFILEFSSPLLLKMNPHLYKGQRQWG